MKLTWQFLTNYNCIPNLSSHVCLCHDRNCTRYPPRLVPEFVHSIRVLDIRSLTTAGTISRVKFKSLGKNLF